MGNQRPNANDRVVDVLRELVAQFGANLVIALARMAIRSSEALQIGDRLNIPNDDVAHGVSTGGRSKIHSRCIRRYEPMPKLGAWQELCGQFADCPVNLPKLSIFYHNEHTFSLGPFSPKIANHLFLLRVFGSREISTFIFNHQHAPVVQ
jgi:hypothetical protein